MGPTHLGPLWDGWAKPIACDSVARGNACFLHCGGAVIRAATRFIASILNINCRTWPSGICACRSETLEASIPSACRVFESLSAVNLGVRNYTFVLSWTDFLLDYIAYPFSSKSQIGEFCDLIISYCFVIIE